MKLNVGNINEKLKRSWNWNEIRNGKVDNNFMAIKLIKGGISKEKCVINENYS